MLSLARMDDRLIGPRLKVRRADKHIEDIETTRKEFVATDPYTHFSYDDPETGDLVYGISVEPHAAEGLRDLSIIAGDAIHNLRSALDLLAYQLVDAYSGKAGDATAFPIWRTEGQFLGGSAGYMRGAHPDAIRVMRNLKPYKGGNETLWRLHRLDATDKHRLLLAVGATQAEILWNFNIGSGDHWVRIKPKRPAILLEDGAEIFRVPAAARDYFESQPKPEFSLYIALREVETPNIGLDLGSTLRNLSRTTTEIIDLFSSYRQLLDPTADEDIIF
jgi:hypothetical protein